MDLNIRYKTNEGYYVKIINKFKKYKVEVQFEDEYAHRKIVYMDCVKSGNIKNPFHKSVCGIGFYGVGEFSKKNFLHMYDTWASMLKRCYSEKTKGRDTYYKNVTVCDEWHNFQNFGKWYEENYPYDIKDIKFNLDKDLLQIGVNNKIYSPNTCVFLPSSINSFLVNNQTNNNTSGYTGASYKTSMNKWVAQIRDFETGKYKHLGTFGTKEEAYVKYIEEREINSLKVKKYLKSLDYLSDDIISKVR